jgi:hypothetical protein
MTLTLLSPLPTAASHLAGTGQASPTAALSRAFRRQNLELRVPDPRADRIQSGQNQRPVRHSTLVPSKTDKSDQEAAANSP